MVNRLLKVLLLSLLGLSFLSRAAAGTGGYIVAWGAGKPYGLPSTVTSGSSVAQVSAGNSHLLVLLTTGELLAYGSNVFGQIAVPMEARTGVVGISAGYWHSLALTANGSVVAFGDNTYNQSTVPDALKGVKVKQVAAGFEHSLALTEDGRVIAWGGTEPYQQSIVPAKLAGRNITAIAAGAWASVAVLDGGKSVVQWGNVDSLPAQVTQQGLLPGPNSVALGTDQVTAILANSSVAVWLAQLPQGVAVYPNAMAKLQQLPAAVYSNVTAVAAKDNVSVALLASGEVVAWGLPDDPGVLQVPADAQRGVFAIAAGNNFGVAVKVPSPGSPPPAANVDRLVAWGAGAPVGVQSNMALNSTVAKLAAGFFHLLVLLADGTLLPFGDNTWNETSIPSEAQVNVTDVAAGAWHSLVVTRNGTLFTFGDNTFNQTRIPAALTGVKVKQVAAGTQHSLALTEDGQVFGWGAEGGQDFGQTRVPAQLTGRNVTAIAAGSWTSIAVLDGGKSIVQWGSNTPVPPEVEQQGLMPGRQSIAVGLDHVTALLPSGKVTVWPAATAGPAYPSALEQLMQVPARALSGVIAVSAAENISVALLETGEVLVWGLPYDPAVLQVPDAADGGVYVMAAGYDAVLAVRAPMQPPPPPAPPPPSPPAPPPVPMTSTNITFTLSMLADAGLASNTSLQDAFSNQLQAAVASFFGVDPGQVQLQIHAGSSPSKRRLQAHGLTRSHRQLLQGSSTTAAATTPLVATAQVGASWATSSDPATPLRLALQMVALNRAPNSLIPEAMVQQFGLTQVALQGPATATPGTLPDVAAPAPSPAPTGHKSSGGLIAGLTIGAVVLVLAAAGAALWWRKRTHQLRARHGADMAAEAILGGALPTADKHWGTIIESGFTNTNNTYSDDPCHAFVVGPCSSMTSTLAPPTNMSHHSQQKLGNSGAVQQGLSAPRVQPPGILAGDPFLSTAAQLTWTDYTPGPQSVRVEAGISDAQLDRHTTTAEASPVVELSSQEVKQQVEILTGGLVGKGGAALVFMCRWPSRFGPDALLAAKLLKNPYDASLNILQAFVYEAKLLASIKHDHVVRLYGYCLELPTVCLIMELLPGSLEDLLYHPDPMRRFRRDWQTAAAPGTGHSAAGAGSPAATASMAGRPALVAGSPAGSPAAPPGLGQELAAGGAGQTVSATGASHATSSDVLHAAEGDGSCTTPSAVGAGQAPTAADVGQTMTTTGAVSHATSAMQPHAMAPSSHASSTEGLLDTAAAENMPLVPSHSAALPQQAGGLMARAGSVRGLLQPLVAGLSFRARTHSGASSTSRAESGLEMPPPQAAGRSFHAKSHSGAISSSLRAESGLEMLPPHAAGLSSQGGLHGGDAQPPQVMGLSARDGSHGGGDALPPQATASAASITTGVSAAASAPSTAYAPSIQCGGVASGGFSGGFGGGFSGSLPSPHRTSMLQVLQICVDVSAGLQFLHNRQLGAQLGSVAVTSLAPVLSSLSSGRFDGSCQEDSQVSFEAQLEDVLSAKVAHRDLKPANVLINSRGRAKLSDFGLARENATTTVHTVHVGAGTLHYMAPELLATRGPGMLPTNRIDIYSLGIMMWEMVAGRKPWSGLNPMQLQMAVAAKKRPTIPNKQDVPPSSSHADLSTTPASFYAVPGFVDLIRACWRQRDHKRPPAAEVHAKLCAMLQAAGKGPAEPGMRAQV